MRSEDLPTLAPDALDQLARPGGVERGRTVAALKGGAATSLVSAAGVAAFFAAGSALFPALIRTLMATAPDLIPLLLPMVAMAAPALLCLPVAAVARRVAEGEARHDLDRGQAAAAGAGIGAAAVAAGALGGVAWVLGSVAGLVLLTPYALSAALGVGLVGAAGFAGVRAARPGAQDEGATPGLYQALTATAASAFTLLGGALGWVLAGKLLPVLSPSGLHYFLGVVGATSVMLGALAPLTYGLARLLDRTFPGANRRALGYGLVLPALLPAVTYGWLTAFYAGPVQAPLAQTFLGFTLGALPHALAVFGALRPGRRQLAATGSAGQLPAAAAAPPPTPPSEPPPDAGADDAAPDAISEPPTPAPGSSPGP